MTENFSSTPCCEMLGLSYPTTLAGPVSLVRPRFLDPLDVQPYCSPAVSRVNYATVCLDFQACVPRDCLQRV